MSAKRNSRPRVIQGMFEAVRHYFSAKLRCQALAVQLLLVIAMLPSGMPEANAHIFVPKANRAGAYPPHEGAGWIGSAWLNLPDSAVVTTITAEKYIEGREPDFTFRTDWIDFPAGPVASVLDADLSTIGDFLDDYIYEVSDPSKLDEPMSHMALRFTGFVKVRIEDEVRIRIAYGMPIWIEFGTFGYDGYNIRVGGIISYERPDSNSGGPWFNWGPAVQAQGLFPITVTYFNRYDPDNVAGAPNAGIELYSWHGEGFAWPAGMNMVHAVRGPGTLAPPSIIYQFEDVGVVPPGDFDADGDVDFKDFQWFQPCFFPPNGFIILPDGCETFDLDGDGDVDLDDLQAFLLLMTGDG